MRKQKTKVVVGAVNAPQAERPTFNVRRFITRKNILFGVGALVVVVAMIMLLTGNKKSTPTPAKQQLSTVALEQKVSELVQKHQLAQAEKLMKSESATTQTVGGYVSLASVQAGQSNYNAAVLTLKAAETKFGMNYLLALQLAQTYTQKADYKNAITYYQKALALVRANPSQVSNPEQTTATLQSTISALEKVKQ